MRTRYSAVRCSAKRRSCTVLRTRGSGPARTEVVYHLKAVRPDELIAMVLRAGFVVVEAPKQ
ncbi:MAG: hypothetical protein KAX19_06275, partial [Candidatus Brocadiae bacterium]|nr:hypothetical protein [Candidatus Brocadiia bacterium]